MQSINSSGSSRKDPYRKSIKNTTWGQKVYNIRPFSLFAIGLNYSVIFSNSLSRRLAPVADPGGGVQGSGPPPLLGHDVGFLTLGPKLDPLLDPTFFCRPTMDPSGASRGGGDHPPPTRPPWNVDDVTRAMSKGGVHVQDWGCFSIFLRADDVTRTMSKGGACECLHAPFRKSCIRAWTPPPFRNPGSAPAWALYLTSNHVANYPRFLVIHKAVGRPLTKVFGLVIRRERPIKFENAWLQRNNVAN